MFGLVGFVFVGVNSRLYLGCSADGFLERIMGSRNFGNQHWDWDFGVGLIGEVV